MQLSFIYLLKAGRGQFFGWFGERLQKRLYLEANSYALLLGDALMSLRRIPGLESVPSVELKSNSSKTHQRTPPWWRLPTVWDASASLPRDFLGTFPDPQNRYPTFVRKRKEGLGQGVGQGGGAIWVTGVRGEPILERRSCHGGAQRSTRAPDTQFTSRDAYP